MPETIDDRWVINRALARIGASPIGSITEDTKKAAQARAVYYDRVDFILGLHEWSFTAKTYALDERAQVAENGYDAAKKRFINGWRYSFTLPGDRLGNPRRVLTEPRCPDAPLREFLVEEGFLFADRRPLWATFSVRAAPDIWSPAARLAIITSIASELCVPISHDAKMSADLGAIAHGAPEQQSRGGLVAAAIAADRAGNASAKPRIWSDPLTQARFS